MKRALTLVKRFHNNSIIEAGTVFDVEDDFPFSKTVIESPSKHEDLERLRLMATTVPPFPQDEIHRQVKENNATLAGVVPHAPLPAQHAAETGPKPIKRASRPT